QEDWPEQTSPMEGLPRATWDRAVGDVARDILGRPSRQFRARMCEVAWRLGDGVGQIPAFLPAVVEVIHAGSLIVDDIEDGSQVRRGGPCLHLTHGVPRALNTGNWMYFWAMNLVDRLTLPAATQDEIRRVLVDAMYRCHLGQSLDLSIAVGELPREWVYRTVATSTMLKTGALMELAARLGAIAAHASVERVNALGCFGRRMGLGLQMLDDFGNLNASNTGPAESKALEDLRNGRPTWPWARASVDLDEPTFAHLQSSVRVLVDGGDADGTKARALAAELRMAVGLKGRRQTTTYLGQALRDLRYTVGERDELGVLAGELQRLEASYG
ncbi:MAG: polyprenyl synthetase family protein, partial [Deltaproteobacteria bacterium]|nr:polyprenyl synthetase family protein [Deltaproteobacteria bacterium]